MSKFYIAMELTTDSDDITLWCSKGVFTQEQMALAWYHENEERRSLKVLPCLDKTFLDMVVEYNNKYEG